MPKRGRWSEEEKDFLAANYLLMTDDEMVKKLDRTRNSVVKMRLKMGLTKQEEPAPDIEGRFRGSYVAGLSEGDKRDFILSELRRTAQYKKTKAVLTRDELSFYEERHVEFMMDPTVETMTSAEKDTLHRKTLTEIRMLRFMQEEKRAIDEFQDLDGEDEKEREEKRKYIANKSLDINACNQVIKECEKSLNVTREQRMKHMSDQAVSFTNLIKDMQNPTVRGEAGYEAAMFRWMARRHYNDQLEKHIFSGKSEPYDTNEEFKSGKEPEGVSSDFTGDREE